MGSLDLTTVAHVGVRIEQPCCSNELVEGGLCNLSFRRCQLFEMRRECKREFFGLKCGYPHERKIASSDEAGDLLVSGGQKCHDFSGALGNGLLEWVEQRQRLETRCPKRAGSRCCRLTVRC